MDQYNQLLYAHMYFRKKYQEEAEKQRQVQQARPTGQPANRSMKSRFGRQLAALSQRLSQQA